MKKTEITVDVLSVEGCQTAQPTVALIERVARRSGISAKIRQRIIATQEEAAEGKFVGSPTVQIGGRDIEPEVRFMRNFGLG